MGTKVEKSRFVKAIIRARKDQGLLQKQVADAVGLTKGAYGHIETGKTALSADIMDKACDFLGLQVLIVSKEAIK